MPLPRLIPHGKFCRTVVVLNATWGARDRRRRKSYSNGFGKRAGIRARLREVSMRHIVGLLSVMLTCFALTTLHAAAASIEGSWIGSGTVSRRANVDRVQCRVRYTKSSENDYATSSVCTTEHGRYEISGHVTNIGGNRYQGTVTSGNETGRVTMVHRGNQQSVTVTSPSGSAKLTLSRR